MGQARWEPPTAEQAAAMLLALKRWQGVPDDTAGYDWMILPSWCIYLTFVGPACDL